jgi:MATE family multidrug resistance protein
MALVAGSALPFCVSSGAYTLKLTFDRLALASYSPISACASLSGGLAAFLLASVFIGLSGYTGVLVAQAHGARRNSQIGPRVWRGIVLSLACGLVLALISSPLSRVFALIGHEETLSLEESLYFRILTWGAGLSLLSTSLTCFWTGRGQTWTVVIVNLFSILLNVVLNFLLIFGAPSIGLTPLGIAGAAIATVLSDLFKTSVLAFLFLSKKNRALFQTLPGALWRKPICREHARLGFHNGLQMALNILTLALFNIFMGFFVAKGQDPAAVVASSLAFTLAAAFLIPISGLSSALTMLVGRGVGAGDLALKRRVIRAGLLLALAHLTAATLVFLAFPDWLLGFLRGAGALQGETLSVASSLVGFASVFLVVEGLGQLFLGALRGAGDVAYATRLSLFSAAFFAIAAPAALRWGGGPECLWALLSVSGLIKTLAFSQRLFPSAEPRPRARASAISLFRQSPTPPNPRPFAAEVGKVQ